MKCKNKKVEMIGIKDDGRFLTKGNVVATITNDELGKTLSLCFDNQFQITIPFEPIERYLK